MRSYGCLTPAAFLLVIGGLMLVVGLEGNIPKLAWTGSGFLAAAFAFGLAAWYFRWQGWD
jgi:membrane protein implicated in regulation of membrane protease activity